MSSTDYANAGYTDLSAYLYYSNVAGASALALCTLAVDNESGGFAEVDVLVVVNQDGAGGTEFKADDRPLIVPPGKSAQNFFRVIRNVPTGNHRIDLWARAMASGVTAMWFDNATLVVKA